MEGFEQHLIILSIAFTSLVIPAVAPVYGTLAPYSIPPLYHSAFRVLVP